MIPVFLHAENTDFEGFSLTAGIKGSLCMKPEEYKGNLLDSDSSLSMLAPVADVTFSYNWNLFFLGLSVTGARQSEKGSIKSQFSPEYTYDQYLVGSLIEFGLCSDWQIWVFRYSGRYAKTTYENADHHIAIGFGPCYSHVKFSSGMSEDINKEMGFAASLRFQYLLFWDIGVDFGFKGFFFKPFGDNTVGLLELGIFYKFI